MSFWNIKERRRGAADRTWTQEKWRSLPHILFFLFVVGKALPYDRFICRALTLLILLSSLAHLWWVCLRNICPWWKTVCIPAALISIGELDREHLLPYRQSRYQLCRKSISDSCCISGSETCIREKILWLPRATGDLLQMFRLGMLSRLVRNWSVVCLS